MADEIIPKKEVVAEAPIEPVSEPIQAPEVAPEPVTAQIPVSEPLTPEPEPIVISEVKTEPVNETPPEESPLSSPIPKEIPPAPESKQVVQPKTVVTPIVVASSINSIPESKPEPIESKPISTKPSQKDLWRRFLDKVQIGKRKKLEKIMIMFSKKSKITNDEVEKFLHVSDATATRYLEILEKENKIKQTGKTGKSVFYSKI